jgi:hypothetical protein
VLKYILEVFAMCYEWDGKVTYDGYLKLVGDVFVKLGSWVRKSYMNELTVLELCNQAVSLLNDIQGQLFFAFYDDRAVKLVVPVLKKFVDGDYPYSDFDFDLENLMRFVDDLEKVFPRLRSLAKRINLEKEEEDRRKEEERINSSRSSWSRDELPF